MTESESEGENKIQPEIYQRNINLVINELGKGRVAVSASMLDLDHVIRLNFVVNPDTKQIVESSAQMVKVPLSACNRTMAKVKGLEGLYIQRGINKEIVHHLGGDTGCVHLVELAINAVSLASATLIGWGSVITGRQEFEALTEDEKIRLAMPFLRNTCLAYKEDC